MNLKIEYRIEHKNLSDATSPKLPSERRSTDG